MLYLEKPLHEGLDQHARQYGPMQTSVTTFAEGHEGRCCKGDTPWPGTSLLYPYHMEWQSITVRLLALHYQKNAEGLQQLFRAFREKEAFAGTRRETLLQDVRKKGMNQKRRGV
jgi:hypothetical protein